MRLKIQRFIVLHFLVGVLFVIFNYSDQAFCSEPTAKVQIFLVLDPYQKSELDFADFEDPELYSDDYKQLLFELKALEKKGKISLIWNPYQNNDLKDQSDQTSLVVIEGPQNLILELVTNPKYLDIILDFRKWHGVDKEKELIEKNSNPKKVEQKLLENIKKVDQADFDRALVEYKKMTLLELCSAKLIVKNLGGKKLPN